MKTQEHKQGSLWIALLMGVMIVVAIVAIIKTGQRDRAGSGLGEGYRYDLSALAYIDPNLIQYEALGPALVTGLSAAHGLAVDRKAQVYIAGQEAVLVMLTNGVTVRKITSPGAFRAVTVAGDGTIYTAKSRHVEVFDAEGQPLTQWDPLGEDALITSLLVTDDTVFVADAGRRQVLLYRLDGTLKGSIRADEDGHFDGFVVPSPYFDMVMGRDGMLRVVNPGRLRIDTFTPAGDFEFSWGEASNGIKGFCGCCNPAALALLPGGGFVTAEKGLMRVKVYNSDGGFESVVAGPEQLEVSMQPKVCQTPEECQADGLDLAVDAAGRIFVLDTRQASVRVFGRKGTSQ